ncbi:glycosyltransferase [Nocardia sp. CDC153]|uniref:glycosyltransferase n=1 Tax=Nocardia sp. CDC153 TaxID=3112167 RepID=UPI002DB56EE8|nr:glycosyltransferase [Nocardia sp. CDC153]MEC3958942.1 glycosyltransferase [Nocardia sp. CDC153]
MRVLISTTPMEGVFAPVAPLARELLTQGHEVLVATAPQLMRRVGAAGLAAVAAGPDAPEAAAAAVALPEFAAGQQPWRIGAVMFSRVMAPRKTTDLLEIVEEFEPQVIVHAPVDLAAPLVARVCKIPSLTYGTGLLLEPELIAAMAEWVAPLWHSFGIEPDAHAGLYRYGYLDPVPASLQPDLGPVAGIARPIRPAVSGSVDDELPEAIQRMGRRPLVYVSLGTVPIFNQPPAFGPLLAGLADLDIDVVTTVGTETVPSDLGPLPANVHVAQWLSLAALLPHCDAVLCHAGAGTTLAALSHGIPLVLSPRGADQFPTASACAATGVARVLTPDRVTPDAVRDAMESVLTEQSYRAAAERLRVEISDRPSAATVAAELPRYVREA